LDFSRETERRIIRTGAAFGIAVFMFTVGGAMEGHGWGSHLDDIARDSLARQPVAHAHAHGQSAAALAEAVKRK
jgi:hypothetical protein